MPSGQCFRWSCHLLLVDLEVHLYSTLFHCLPLLLSGIDFRPVLEKIVILIRRAQRPQWQGSRAARYSINNGQAADAANEAAPPPGKVTSISRVGLNLNSEVRGAGSVRLVLPIIAANEVPPMSDFGFNHSSQPPATSSHCAPPFNACSRCRFSSSIRPAANCCCCRSLSSLIRTK